MQTKDLQNVVLSKYKDEQSCTKIQEDRCGSMVQSTIESWYKMMGDSNRITLIKLSTRPRTVRTEANIREDKALT